MAGRKNEYLVVAIVAAVVISGIAVYYPSQQQAAVAQVSSNTTNPVNNSSMIISNTTNPVNNSSVALTPTPFPVDTRQYNLTYGEWTAKWWQWAYSTPEDINPAADVTGENCDKGQTGPVWFLAGTFGGLNERSCVIPAGKSILFPVMNAACSKLEYPELQTESELRTCAVSSNDGVTELTVTIDGQPINETQLRSTRVQSPLFDLNLPEGNIISGHRGSTQAVSDGFWVFLAPLAPGAHEIHFRGAIVDFTTASQNNFVTESLYHVTIAE
jgi:hypothetical protein